MCFVDLERRHYRLASIDSIRKNKPLRICLLLVLRSSVDGLDAISTPINIKYGAEVIVQIHNGGNSKDVQGFCTLLEFVLQRHLWELQGFRGLP